MPDEPSGRLTTDVAALTGEIAEIDLLITQATGEAARHETKRANAAAKLEALGADGDLQERLDLTSSLVGLTSRAALMESQVEVLQGKRRTLARYRDALVGYVDALETIDATGATGLEPSSQPDLEGPMPVAVSRLLTTAQEDLRREIARAMHDGPAQSLTNIVLQAQIVERLVRSGHASATDEVGSLVEMVQSTLEATKTFIFDVRPMVLDDLGLVPTLRRSARDRGRRSGIPIMFESMGQDRRLPMDLESALFRSLDEALVGYLGVAPEQLSLRLDWGDQLEARVVATRAVVEGTDSPESMAPPTDGAELPPALAAMVEDRRADARSAEEAAVRDAVVVLPAGTWGEIRDRAASAGITAELLADGGELLLVVDLPAESVPPDA